MGVLTRNVWIHPCTQLLSLSPKDSESRFSDLEASHHLHFASFVAQRHRESHCLALIRLGIRTTLILTLFMDKLCMRIARVSLMKNSTSWSRIGESDWRRSLSWTSMGSGYPGCVACVIARFVEQFGRHFEAALLLSRSSQSDGKCSSVVWSHLSYSTPFSWEMRR